MYDLNESSSPDWVITDPGFGCQAEVEYEIPAGITNDSFWVSLIYTGSYPMNGFPYVFTISVYFDYSSESRHPPPPTSVPYTLILYQKP